MAFEFPTIELGGLSDGINNYPDGSMPPPHRPSTGGADYTWTYDEKTFQKELERLIKSDQHLPSGKEYRFKQLPDGYSLCWRTKKSGEKDFHIWGHPDKKAFLSFKSFYEHYRWFNN